MTETKQLLLGTAQKPPGRKPSKGFSFKRFEPFLYLGPVLLLIGFVVIYPVIAMFTSAFSDIGRSGKIRDFNGIENFIDLFGRQDLPRIAVQSVFWVLLVVGITFVIAWPIAVLLNQKFPGRTLVRYSVIVPWAASLVMTSLIFKWMFNFYYGSITSIFNFFGIPAVDWLGSATFAWVVLIATGVFVSVPFTVYVILAGLQTIPNEVYEAAKLDGARWYHTWFYISRPLVKNSVLVALVLNVINSFNNFPIIWLITEGGPNRGTHTAVTFMYELAFRSQSIGESAALSIINFVFLMVLVAVYLRMQRKNSEGML